MLSLPDFREKQILIIRAEWGKKTSLRIRNDNLIFLQDGEIVNRLSCHKIFAVFVMGDVMISTQLINNALRYGVSFYFLKHNFEMYSSFLAQADGNYLLRMKQYSMSIEEELVIAKGLIKNKINNQALLLYGEGLIKNKKEYTKLAFERVDSVENHQSLLGVEGNYSKKYFQEYFKPVGWHRRAPRTKEDVPNYLMDIGYTFLFNYIDSLLRLYGFDTYKGCYHKLFFARRSLACDIQEPFRCFIDKQILKSYNLQQINEKDFKFINGRYVLPFNKNQNYTQIFAQSIMDHKEDLYIFVREFYRFIMNPEENEFPQYKVKTKKKVRA